MSNKKTRTGLDPKVLADAQANAERMFKVQRNALAESSKSLKDIEERYARIVELEEQLTTATKEELAVLKQKIVFEKQEAKLKEQKQKQQQKTSELASEMRDIAKDIQKQYSNILDTSFDQQSADKKLTDLVKRRIQAVKQNNEEEITLLSTAIETQLAYKAQLPYLQRVQSTFSTINDIAQDLAGSISGAFDSLPGGKYLSKMLGLDTLGESFKTSINAAGKAFVESGGSISAATKAFGGSMKMLLNPVTLGIAAFAGLFLLLKNITDQAKEFSKETGLTVAASQQLVQQSYDIQTSFDNRLSSQKDILDVQQQTISQLGSIGKLSGDVALRVSETGKAFGYGAQEAANVQAQMMLISGMSQTAAIEAQEFTAQLALAEGVAPGAVMKDIAKSSAISAKYFAGNPRALGAAAVEAAKLGLSLDQMAKTSEAILNIEQSLEDQYVASAMLGRQLNFDSARRAAAEGDIAGAAKEVLKELGGIEEFENASVFAKQRMAAAAGMTVEELNKTLTIQDKLGDLTQDQLAAMNGLNLSAADIKSKSPEQLKTLLAQQQATEEMATSMEKLKNEMINYILPVAKGLIPIFNMIAGIIKVILAPFTLMRYLAEQIGEIVGGWAAALGPFGIVLKGIAGIAILLAAYGAYASLAWIPTVGPILGAIAAAAVTTAGFTALNKVGDLAMPAGDGPIVTSPSEGTIFQGTRNDEVAMGPGVIDAAQGNGTTVVANNASAAIDYDKLAAAVAKAIQNLKIIIDDSAVSAINKQGAVAASYR